MESFYCEEVSPLLEQSLEFTMSWNNLMEDSMLIESSLLLEEDNSGSKASKVKEMAIKFKDWITEKVKTIINALKKIAVRVQEQAIQAIAKAKKFEKVEGLKGLKVGCTTYNYVEFSYERVFNAYDKLNTAIYTGCSTYYNTFKQYVNKENSSAAVKKFDELNKTAIDMFKNGIYTNGIPEKVDSVERSCSDALQNIVFSKNKISKVINKCASDVMKFEKNGYAIVGLFTKDPTYKASLSVFRNAISSSEQACMITITACIRILVDSMKVCNAGVAKLKENKANA